MLVPIVLMLIPIVLHTCLHNEGNLECFDIMKLSIRKLCVQPSCQIRKMYPSLCSQVSPTHLPTYLALYLIIKLTVPQSNSPLCMELECPLPCSQQPTTFTYHEPALSCPHPHSVSSHYGIILPSTLRSSNRSLCFSFPHQNPVWTCLVPIHATCLDHLILLGLITQAIFGDGYKSWSCTLCSLHHSPGTSSLLRPIIFLSTLFPNTLP